MSKKSFGSFGSFGSFAPVASERGVTLIEASIVVATVAVLSAMLAPTASTYIDQARQARTRQDVQTIADGINEFITDNGEHQFLQDASNGASPENPPTRTDGNRVDLLVSDGDIPVLAAAIAADTLWTLAINGLDVDTLSNHLAENAPNEDGDRRYRNPSDITIPFPGGNNIDFGRPDSSGLNAPYAWRGPYLRSPVNPDPWGNRYAVNVAFLDPAPSAVISGISVAFGTSDYPRLDVFVVSAGPDEEIDTTAAQDGAVPSDDDFVFVVSANAK